MADADHEDRLRRIRKALQGADEDLEEDEEQDARGEELAKESHQEEKLEKNWRGDFVWTESSWIFFSCEVLKGGVVMAKENLFTHSKFLFFSKFCQILNN